MQHLARLVLARPRLVIAGWVVVLAVASPFALQLAGVAQGGSEAIRGSESHAVMQTLERDFGRGFSHLVPVVIEHRELAASEPRYAQAVLAAAEHLGRDPAVRAVIHPWNSGLPELLGRDGKSVLLLVQPDAGTLAEAENLTGRLRDAMAAAGLPDGFTARVTGMSAMFHDLNRRSATDLLHAEMVGIPLTLLVLFLVFRTPLAAGLALGVAITAVTLSSAVLFWANRWVPVSTLAQNIITMIGLGAGTDYALFVLSRHRQERARGTPSAEAVMGALAHAGPAVLVSGLAVAGGFGALFLVNASFMHSLALGGVTVVGAALAATFTLLPAVLLLAGDHFGPASSSSANPGPPSGWWARWAALVMRRPWAYLALALALTAVFALPALRARSWSFGARDLPLDTEARAGYESLAAHFEQGWMGPVAITLEAPDAGGVWAPARQDCALALAAQLRRDPRVAAVLGYPRLLEALGDARRGMPASASLPPALAPAAHTAVGQGDRTAVMVVVSHEPPESRPMMEFVDALRATTWPAATAAGLRIRIGGGTALVHDFDREMFASLGRVLLAIVVLTFALLSAFFRSVAVPLKAIAVNLLSVVAAYGFLVLLFQDGHGAGLLGITPPGGLNSFVVLMLFTILFGLSMDYEIFLLSQIREEYVAGHDNTASVAAGLGATAGIITSAAAVMVCLFGSFGFFGLTASREFGLGLAFAVAFDATIVRLLIVPAAMRLLGAWNWWPGTRRAR